MTHQSRKNAKRLVVICAGGHGKLGTKIGDYVVAFALPLLGEPSRQLGRPGSSATGSLLVNDDAPAPQDRGRLVVVRNTHLVVVDDSVARSLFQIFTRKLSL